MCPRCSLGLELIWPFRSPVFPVCSRVLPCCPLLNIILKNRKLKLRNESPKYSKSMIFSQIVPDLSPSVNGLSTTRCRVSPGCHRVTPVVPVFPRCSRLVPNSSTIHQRLSPGHHWRFSNGPNSVLDAKFEKTPEVKMNRTHLS